MKHFRVLILENQQKGPITVTENWVKISEPEPDFNKKFKIIGECDAGGNLLEDLKSSNFSPVTAEIPDIFLPKTNLLPLEKTNENGNTEQSIGTEARKETEKLGEKPKLGRRKKSTDPIGSTGNS